MSDDPILRNNVALAELEARRRALDVMYRPPVPVVVAKDAPAPVPDTPVDDPLLAAVEDYVARACRPLAAKIVELERRLAQRAPPPDGLDELVEQLAAETRGYVDERLKGLPHDGGLWERGKSYRRGAMCTHRGSTFICTRDTADEIGGDPASSAWRMMAQRGKDAR